MSKKYKVLRSFMIQEVIPENSSENESETIVISDDNLKIGLCKDEEPSSETITNPKSNVSGSKEQTFNVGAGKNLTMKQIGQLTNNNPKKSIKQKARVARGVRERYFTNSDNSFNDEAFVEDWVQLAMYKCRQATKKGEIYEAPTNPHDF